LHMRWCSSAMLYVVVGVSFPLGILGLIGQVRQRKGKWNNRKE
jgi:hypothetical protein